MRDKPRREQSAIATIVIWAARAAILVMLYLVAVAVYHLLLRTIVDDRRILTGLFALWVVTAYIVLPRVHRTLTKWYIPNYFIGRVRTGDGLLGDPVNLAVDGTEEELVAAMTAAGWVRAEELNLGSTLKMVKATILRRSYPSAPVSSLFLFSRQQDLAFQQEVGGSTSQRHHVRFWRSPEGWYLPGGYQADWLGAATFDRAVGFSLFTGQITHKIAENTDEERDYVVETVLAATPGARVDVMEHFVSGYHDRNGGGDRIITDGSLPFLRLPSAVKRVPVAA
ncbi:MAG: LssY C-terminal domain-containing protein [Candidatus Sumerlaeaceae bacterium]|nr:LssY C-terminal domain-containing protein [Candidatus Sumerlaeaceae bacterium]